MLFGMESSIKLLKSGKLGAIVLAGGNGSRLQFAHPKGCFPVTAFKKKSLFERLVERVKAASTFYDVPLDIAFMTSPQNHEETVRFFEINRFFGLEKRRLFFFQSGELPLLDENGKEVEVFTPNGNGSLFKSFASSTMAKAWAAKEVFTVISIDNPLADPFDLGLIQKHLETQSAVTVTAIEAKNPSEKVGRIIQKNSKVWIEEYGQTTEDMAPANAGIYAFSSSFFKKAATFCLPLHVVKKGVFLKREFFIFDVLAYANKVGVFHHTRESCFAPLKNFEGEDSIEDVRELVQAFDRKTFYEISGFLPPQSPFELSAHFYYPTSALKEKWQKLALNDLNYIEEE